MATRFLVCRGTSCASQHGRALLLDIEELCAASEGVACEPHKCMGRCGYGPNVRVVTDSKNEIVSGITSFSAVEKLVTSQIDGTKLGKLSRQIGQIKYDARRTDEPAEALRLLDRGFSSVGADRDLSELSVECRRLLGHLFAARAQTLKTAGGGTESHSELLLQDVRRATELTPDRARVWLLLAQVLEDRGCDNEVAAALSRALSCGGLGLDRDLVARQIHELAIGRHVGAGTEQFSTWCVETMFSLPSRGPSILLRLRCCQPEQLLAHLNVGDVWHVDVMATLANGVDVARTYTPLSSAKEYQSGILELAIKVYPQGQLTPLLANLCPGGLLKVSPPAQTLEPSAYTGVLVVAGGSAATVALQICESVLRRHPKRGMVRLILCNHFAEDVMLSSRFDELLQTFPTFRVTHCISEGPLSVYSSRSSAQWKLGRLNLQLLSEVEPHLKAVVSGPPGLCSSAMSLLLKTGRQLSDIAVLDDVTHASGDLSAAMRQAGPHVESASVAAVAAKKVDALIGGSQEQPAVAVDFGGSDVEQKERPPRRCCFSFRRQPWGI